MRVKQRVVGGQMNVQQCEHIIVYVQRAHNKHVHVRGIYFKGIGFQLFSSFSNALTNLGGGFHAQTRFAHLLHIHVSEIMRVV